MFTFYSYLIHTNPFAITNWFYLSRYSFFLLCLKHRCAWMSRSIQDLTGNFFKGSVNYTNIILHNTYYVCRDYGHNIVINIITYHVILLSYDLITFLFFA